MQSFCRIFVSLGVIISISTVRADYAETSGQITMEAEDYHTLSAPNTTTDFWSAKCDVGTFSGDASMFVGPNDGNRITGPGETSPGSPAVQSPRLSYNINFATNGTYNIWLKALSTGGGGDSVHVGFDNTFVGTVGLGPEADFTWVNTNALLGGTSPITFVINDAPATHTFDIWMREDGVYIDKILLTTDFAADPANAELLGPLVADNPTAVGPGVPTVAAPSIVPPGGLIAPAATVSLSTCTSGANLFYTLNGSNPTPDLSNPSTIPYTAGFMVPADPTGVPTQVRAIASALLGTSRNDSTITSAIFNIVP